MSMQMTLVFQNTTSINFSRTSQSGFNNGSHSNLAPSSIPANQSTTAVTVTGTNINGNAVYSDGQGNTFTFSMNMPITGANSFTFASTHNAYVAVISGNPMGTTSTHITVLIETPSQADVTLAGNYGNTQNFVENMFATNVRSAQAILNYNNSINPTYPVDLLQSPPFCVGFANYTSIQRIVSAWSNMWCGNAAPAIALNSDLQALQMLSNYVKTNMPNLWVPNLQFLGWQGPAHNSLPVYIIDGYTHYPLLDNSNNWILGNLQVLLTYLTYGAHIVTITDPTNVGTETLPDFYDYAYGNSATQSNFQQLVWDSHYSSVGGQNSGMSYPCTIITSDTVPSSSPLLCSLLIGPTVEPTVVGHSPYLSGQARCDFMQLEGWRQFGTSKSGWHDADYTAYQQTLWNFSTYGACAFSEKRGTALFLAPNGWTANTWGQTIMPPYLGAQTPQSWFRRDLVTVPQWQQQQIASTLVNTGVSFPFTLSHIPTGAITVWMEEGITANLKHGNGFVVPIQRGTILPQNDMSSAYNYYIDNASYAGQFQVTFTTY